MDVGIVSFEKPETVYCLRFSLCGTHLISKLVFLLCSGFIGDSKKDMIENRCDIMKYLTECLFLLWFVFLFFCGSTLKCFCSSESPTQYMLFYGNFKNFVTLSSFTSLNMPLGLWFRSFRHLSIHFQAPQHSITSPGM